MHNIYLGLICDVSAKLIYIETQKFQVIWCCLSPYYTRIEYKFAGFICQEIRKNYIYAFRVNQYASYLKIITQTISFELTRYFLFNNRLYIYIFFYTHLHQTQGLRAIQGRDQCVLDKRKKNQEGKFIKLCRKMTGTPRLYEDNDWENIYPLVWNIMHQFSWRIYLSRTYSLLIEYKGNGVDSHLCTCNGEALL